jgi:hypothetical protein
MSQQQHFLTPDDDGKYQINKQLYFDYNAIISQPFGKQKGYNLFYLDIEQKCRIAIGM